MGKDFVVGDIHGAHRALQQCLTRAGFDYASDRLICLGDVCDGWPEVRECVNELLKIRNLVYVLGNHDQWALDWMNSGVTPDIWLTQGGRATVQSYGGEVDEAHLRFFRKAKFFHEEEERLFVHAGISPGQRAHEADPQILMWDRTLVRNAMDFHRKGLATNLTSYTEVFVGHTPVSSPRPVKYCEVWMMDTGAGWYGPLSMMNLNSYEVFSSDPVPSLYPGIEGR